MKLTIDIGNTSITCGLFSKNKLIKKLNSPSKKSLLNLVKKNIFKKIIISSVVPNKTKKYISMFHAYEKNNILIINHENSNLNLSVTDPKTIGADRLCNIKAAIKLYKYPTIIVDFGTATTYDTINKNGCFIGGAIAPGIETSAEHLIKKAALLSKTDLQFPKNIIGKDTKENIQSGIMYGAVDQVEGMIERIKKTTNQTYNIVITGGLGKTISPQLTLKHILDSDLTLKGMLYIDESNT